MDVEAFGMIASDTMLSSMGSGFKAVVLLKA